jgi:tripartite-type tricarboxylate transporter receptor subunit TctC
MKSSYSRFARLLSIAAIIAAVTFGFAFVAWAQAARTIKIIAPFPPGGSVDVLSRLLGDQISKAEGPTALSRTAPVQALPLHMKPLRAPPRMGILWSSMRTPS